MNWEKLGRVYVASGERDWAQQKAYVPNPVVFDDRIRVFVSLLDDEQVGRVGYVDVDGDDPTSVLGESDHPVLDIGAPGTFDDNGVTATCVVNVDNVPHLYYFGWQLGVKIRYFLFAGVGRWNDRHGVFERVFEVPILDRVDGERFLRSAPFVVPDESGYEMWYVSGDEWIDVDGKKVPTYDLRYTRSSDGYDWGQSPGTVCLEPNRPDEYGFGRPYVIRENNQYRMWYSVRTRSQGYRIGYAESDDGVDWQRKDDQVGIDVSGEGWDSEMICFPSVVDVGGERYMFYNGNEFGATGFGVARLN